LLTLAIIGCKDGKKGSAEPEVGNDLAAFFEKYYEERLQFFPLEATSIGDNRYNDILPISFTDSYRSKLKAFYERYLTELNISKRMTYRKRIGSIMMFLGMKQK